jgi:Diadenosine tetraphosphate (Ap4A) hydrolase and other HIT family hydrolases
MASQPDCPFCEIINGNQPADVVAETTQYLCFLDKYPVTEGHALVVPKDHIQQFSQLTGTGLFSFLQRAHTEIREEFSPDATNIGLNNGQEAGQTVAHLHWHIIPRYAGDIPDPTGGVRGVIPDKRVYDE